MTRTTLNTYYEENNLADYWISLPTADRAALDKVAAVPGVTHVRARTTVDMDTTLSDDITVSVTAYDGAMDINIPLLREGELLDENDKRGCLVEERFAVAQNLSLGAASASSSPVRNMTLSFAALSSVRSTSSYPTVWLPIRTPTVICWSTPALSRPSR